MLIAVHAIGRMKAGPDQELAGRYFARFEKAGPSVGLEFGGVLELPESRSGSAEERRRDEADRLAARLAKGAAMIVLDERGADMTSADLSRRIASLRDSGRRAVAFVIGGPDGLHESLQREAQFRLSFGRLTWPHQLVRVMLAEQLYRVATILAGHPYHRE
jgi:23S rRNA (pseudouridine1915-N3)-methyltransferase